MFGNASTPMSHPVTEMGHARKIDIDVVRGLTTQDKSRVIVTMDEPGRIGVHAP